MATRHISATLLALGAALALSACANDGLLSGSGATAALPEKPKVDASCAPLAARIDELRREGVAERVEQAAAGKGTTVSVKRDSLAKIAELNKANADYQQRCSTYSPAPGAAKAATVTSPATPAATKTAAVAPKAKKAAAPEAAAVPPPVSDAATEAKKQ